MEVENGSIEIEPNVDGATITVETYHRNASLQLTWADFVGLYNEMGNILKQAQVAYGTPPEVRQDGQ